MTNEEKEFNALYKFFKKRQTRHALALATCVSVATKFLMDMKKDTTSREAYGLLGDFCRDVKDKGNWGATELTFYPDEDETESIH